MNTISIVKTIDVKLNASSGNQIIELFNDSLNAFNDAITKCIFIKNLKLFSQISSLTGARLPNLKLQDDVLGLPYKTLDIEYNSPRKQLNLFIGSPGNWYQIGSINLLNPSGYSYRMYDLLGFITSKEIAELEIGKSIGVQIVNVGYGLLQNNDIVTIHGSYTQEYVLPNIENTQCSCNQLILELLMGLYNPQPGLTIPANLFVISIPDVKPSKVSVATDYVKIADKNALRGKITIWNQGTSRVIITQKSDPVQGSASDDIGSFPLEPGGFFFDDYPAFNGIYEAKAVTGTCQISVKDFSIKLAA